VRFFKSYVAIDGDFPYLQLCCSVGFPFFKGGRSGKVDFFFFIGRTAGGVRVSADLLNIAENFSQVE